MFCIALPTVRQGNIKGTRLIDSEKADNFSSRVSKNLIMSTTFIYKHLYYFWVVAKEGGISRAAEKLDMAAQAVSAQVYDWSVL
jgi:hypothetical protein